MDSVRLQFDRAAQQYHHKAQLQREVAQTLAERFLPQAAGSILEIGCGTGFLTRHLLERYPQSELVATDISPKMIGVAQLELPKDVNWQVVDFWQLPLQPSFALVASSAVLQWLGAVDRVAKRLAQLVSVGGSLVLSSFVDGTLEQLHSLRRELFCDKTPRQHLEQPEAVCQALAAAGFSLDETAVEVYERRHQSFAALLRSIHDLGVNAGPLGVGARALTRGELERLGQEYVRRHPRLTAQYRVLFVRATRQAD